MTKHRLAIVALLIVLFATNVWWAYRMIDSGITHTYLKASFETTNELLSQSLAILPVVARHGAKRSDIIKAARVPNDSTEPFEKDGYVWVGQLGLQFNAQGEFIKAVTPFALDNQ